MPAEPKVEMRKGRVGPAAKQQIIWALPPTDVSPENTAVLYLDREVVEVTSDKRLVITIERRRQGAADRYAIDIDVQD